MKRREFIKVSTLAGGGMLLSFTAVSQTKTRMSESVAPVALGHFLTISPTGEILFQLTKHEMGQGVSTSMAMIIADELGADWDQVKIEIPDADAPKFRNDTYGGHGTGGSNSIIQMTPRLRKSGAIARQLLTQAGANQLKTDVADCFAEKSFIISRSNGSKLSFGEIAEAASKLSIPTVVKLKDHKDFTLIGTAQAGKLIPAIVTGQNKYGIDTYIPNMLHAVVARCPVYRGKLKTFDGTKALSLNGVKKIVSTASVSGVQGSLFPYDIREGVAVLADCFWNAKKGREALSIKWETGVNGTRSLKDFEALAAEKGTQKVDPAGFRGDENAAVNLDHVKKSFYATYIFPYQLHALMEPLNCVAHFKGDACEFWVGTQSADHLIDEINRVFGIKKENVIVHLFSSGGGFGRRFYPDMAIEAACISREAGNVPVKVLWTREDDFQTNAAHCYQRFDYQASINDKDELYAWYEKEVRTYTWGRTITPPELTWTGYNIPNARYDFEDFNDESIIQSVAWRAVMANGWALSECFVDELAVELKKDPYEFRLSLLQEGREVNVGHSQKISNSRLLKVLKLAAEKSNWSKPSEKGKGKGIAVYPYLHGNSYCAIVAEVSVVDKKVIVDKVTCAVDCGLVVNPSGARNQIEGGVVWGLGAVLYGGVDIENGRMMKSNFHQQKVVRMNECPVIDVYFVEDAGDQPWGTGELSNPVIVPAVLNAVSAALGQRIRSMPISL